MTVTGSSVLAVYVNTLQRGSSSVSFGEDKQSDDTVYDVTTMCEDQMHSGRSTAQH